MEKIKSFFNKTNNLILSSIASIAILIAVHFILKIFNLKLRQWLYTTVFTICTLLIITSLIIKFIKKSKKTKIIIVSIFSIIITLCIIFWKIVPLGLLLLLLIINPKTEHVVQRQENQYVACVQSFLTNTTVYYHEYINFLVMEYEPEFEEYYNGAYDPIERKKENANENKIPNVEPSNSEQIQIETETPLEILYEKEIRKDTMIRIINEGHILGGRMIIRVEKTNNNGETWINQIKSSDGCITVNREAEYIFINENVGFINNKSLFILGKENDSLLVTVDGGQSFKNANFIFPLDIENTVFNIKELPYLEDNKLKIKIYPSDNSEKTYYEFASVDNGLNWIYYK